MRGLVVLLTLGFSSASFGFAGAGSIPHGYVYPGYNGAGSHAFVPTGEARFWNGVARTTAIVEAAGKTAATSAAFSRVAGAGRYVWGACYANPIICAGGAAFIAYMMQSNITRDEDTGIWGKRVGSPDGLQYKDSLGYWHDDLSSLCSNMASYYSIGGSAYKVTKVTYARSAYSDGYCEFQVGQSDKSVGSYESRPVVNPPRFEPVTQEQLEEHFSKFEPSDDAANEAGAAGVPMPTAQPQLAPTRTPAGEPYKNSQGQTRQDVMDCVHAPQAAAPLAFECTMKSVDPATTSTTRHPDYASSPAAPPGSASSPTGTPSPSQPEEKPSDLCALHPDIVACAKFGTPPQSEPITKRLTPVNFVSEPLGLPAACPAPIPGPGGVSVTFDSACEAFRLLRPLVVAMGAIVGMLMVVGALRTS